MRDQQRDAAPLPHSCDSAKAAAATPLRTIPSSAIFAGELQIGIEHHGEVYRLAITRQGKLILTK